jgi:N6-L-threonylcarbamoyladenine synthase
MVVLAIESTLDETGCAIARLVPSSHKATTSQVEIISDIKASSAEIHAKYGGVIPEIAAREQIAAIVPVIQEAMGQAELIENAHLPDGQGQWRIDKLDAIAVTEGPGMIGCLLIGVETAKALAMAWKKPLIRVNHMAAHVLANYIIGEKIQGIKNSKAQNWQAPELPAVALIVSGGHTDIMLLKSLTEWEWLGGTRDDAAGEAFDKAARAMGFPYPGGPAIAKMAMETTSNKLQIPKEMKLPRPMIHEDNLEMSFSGLKTAIINLIENGQWKIDNDVERAMLAREFNQAVVDVLVKKTMMAVEKYKPRSVLLGGGVAANQLLRTQLQISISKLQVPTRFFVPDLKYCTDNAAMIAACALMRPDYIDPLKLKPNPGLEIG